MTNEPKKPDLTDDELEKVSGGTGDPDRPIVVGVPPNPCVAIPAPNEKIAFPPGPTKMARPVAANDALTRGSR